MLNSSYRARIRCDSLAWEMPIALEGEAHSIAHKLMRLFLMASSHHSLAMAAATYDSIFLFGIVRLRNQA